MMHARVALFGAAGYSGLELVKILSIHPRVQVACAASDTHAGKRVAELTGAATDLVFVRTEEALATPADVAVLAVPPEPAAKLATILRARGTKVVDLSHAFRADENAVYGLTSLFASEVTAGTALVANPGCYATCVITALAPLVQGDLIAKDVVVSAGSGVTGAGRTSDEALSLGELHDNVRAYKVLRHQHVPEIERALARIAPAGGVVPRVILTTHLLPITRGIFATITVQLTSAQTSASLTERMRATYADDPTVVVMPTPEDVAIRRIVGTNQCHVGVAAAGDVAVVISALDNLGKGAAGQAVENLNLVLGLPRIEGLRHLARHV